MNIKQGIKDAAIFAVLFVSFGVVGRMDYEMEIEHEKERAELRDWLSQPTEIPITDNAGNQTPIEQWDPVTITVYADKFHGRKTANGERFDQTKLTMAVPPKRWRELKETYQTLRWGGRSVTVWVNDKCPAGTYDLSKAAMHRLTGDFKPHKLKGEMLRKGAR